MTKEERQKLAEQLLQNPVWDMLFDRLEKTAVEDMIHTKDEEQRADLAKRVQAIRTLRGDCVAWSRSTRPPKAAPA